MEANSLLANTQFSGDSKSPKAITYRSWIPAVPDLDDSDNLAERLREHKGN